MPSIQFGICLIAFVFLFSALVIPKTKIKLGSVGSTKILRLRNKTGGNGHKGGYGAKGVKTRPSITKATNGVDGQDSTTKTRTLHGGWRW